jgi:hypothetical protein
MSFATEEFKEQIRTEHLRPAFQRDVEDFTDTRFANRKWGERLELVATVCTALAMGSISIGLWSEELSRTSMFASLLLKAGNLTLLTVANVLKKRASRSTDQLNHTLKSVGIDTHIPNVAEDTSTAKNISNPPTPHE